MQQGADRPTIYRKVKSVSGTAWTSWQSLGGPAATDTQPAAVARTVRASGHVFQY
jgi:hypothetical protein